MKNCLTCDIEFEPKNSLQKFCSSICKTKKNRQTRRIRENKKCKECNTLIDFRANICFNCQHTFDDVWSKRTIEYVLVTTHHRSSAFARIRDNARSVAKKVHKYSCIKCGYSKHIEIAHIKSIASFPLDTLISTVNHPDNLVPLCPNCHWEYDNL